MTTPPPVQPPAQPPAPQPPVAQTAPSPKKGLAVTALVLGIVAILGSWIPFLSIVSIFIGVIGLVFGIIATVKAFKGTAGGKVLAIVGSALAALAIIFGFVSTAAGVSAVDDAIEELDESLETTTEATPEDSDDVVDEETSEAPAETEEPASEEGTRDNPFPAGTTLSNDEVEVVLADANWNADELIAAENMFNEPAPEGTTYVLLPVTITNVASVEPVSPWLELNVFYVAPDGRSFDEASVVAPDDLSNIDDLYEGGVGSGNLVYAIPTDVQEGGVWGVEVGWFSDTAFVAAQ